MSSSIGMMTFPIESHKIPWFQSTNQLNVPILLVESLNFDGWMPIKWLLEIHIPSRSGFAISLGRSAKEELHLSRHATKKRRLPGRRQKKWGADLWWNSRCYSHEISTPFNEIQFQVLYNVIYISPDTIEQIRYINMNMGPAALLSTIHR